MNQTIIEQLELLVQYVKKEIIISQSDNDTKATTTNMFRLKVFKRLLDLVKSIDFEIKDANDLKGIPGIAEGSLTRVDEILKTGKLSEISDLSEKNKIIEGIRELEKVIGIGPKIASYFVKRYDITTIDQLKKAIETNKIKVNDKVKLGLKYYGIVTAAIPREETEMIEKEFKAIAKKIDKSLEVFFCGSYRRARPISNDIDVLLCHPAVTTIEQVFNPDKSTAFMQLFVDALTKKGILLDHITDKNYKTKYMGFLKYKDNPVRRVDIRLVPLPSLPAALLANTGPAELNEYMRGIAKSKGMLLSEYGLYRKVDGKMVPIEIKIEKDIFDNLGITYLEPEKRNQFAADKTKKFSN